jgi:predicted negative regulator of RcsB-dependent stress response
VAKHHKDAPADTLEELESVGERLMQWVGANPAIVLGILGAILLGAAGYGGYRAYSHAQAAKASTALAALHGEFVAAMGGKVTDIAVPEPANQETAKTVRTEYADKYLAVAKEWSGTPTAALGLLEAGELFAKLGNPDRALEVAMQALQQTPADSPIRSVIESRVASLQEEKGDFEAAARSYEAAAAVPGNPLHADALAQAARSWVEAGKTEQALAIYQRLKTETPDLDLAPHIQARLEELAARSGASVPATNAAALEATPAAKP